MARISSFVALGNTVIPVRRPSPPRQRRHHAPEVPAASPAHSPLPHTSIVSIGTGPAFAKRSGSGLPLGQPAPAFIAQSLSQAVPAQTAQPSGATASGHHLKYLNATMAYRFAANDDGWVIGPVRPIQLMA